jgi:hypothetical protein
VWRRWAWAGLVVAGSGVSVSTIGARAQIHVEFLADGRCTVSATGEGFHSILTYLPQTPVSPTSELRCAIPPVPEGLQVDLTVTLPRGVAPSRDDSPRLSWTERDYRWIGTASLPAAPAVVRIPESGNRSAFSAWLRRWTAVGAAGAVAGVLAVLGLRRRAKFSAVRPAEIK